MNLKEHEIRTLLERAVASSFITINWFSGESEKTDGYMKSPEGDWVRAKENHETKLTSGDLARKIRSRENQGARFEIIVVSDTYRDRLRGKQEYPQVLFLSRL